MGSKHTWTHTNPLVAITVLDEYNVYLLISVTEYIRSILNI